MVTQFKTEFEIAQPTRLFAPKSIAIVGATERSMWSVAALDNLARFGFTGKIIPVNPKGGTIQGLNVATSCTAAGEPIDAALVMVPEAALIDVIADLKTAGVGGAVVLSSGFAETGHAGAARQSLVAAAARRAGIRLLGPNCLGFANFLDSTPIWTTPLRRPMPNPNVAVVSQSGALASHMEQFAYQQRIALTHMISTGNEADITVADAIDYLVGCDQARAIAVFLESVRDPVRFEATVRKANAAGKAVVVLKVGASEAAANAAQAHTGSLVGNDRVFNALCSKLGVVRTSSLEETIVTADLCGRIGPVPRGGLGLIAMSGGLCEIATDKGDAEGVAIPALSAGTIAKITNKLPAYATPNNPLDLTGAAMLEPGLISHALEAVADDPNIGLIVFLFEAPAKDDAPGFAGKFLRAVGEGIGRAKKPGIMVSPTTTAVSGEARAMTARNGIIYSGAGLNHALAAIRHLCRWSERRAMPQAAVSSMALAAARPRTERAVLDHLAVHGVRVVPGSIVRSADEAVAAAKALGSPAVLKIASGDIQHKTDIGGVALNVLGEADIRAAFRRVWDGAAAARPDAKIDGIIVSPLRPKGIELFVGTMRDPQWGAAIVVGLGGVFVEILKDTSLRLLPVTEADALEMLDDLRGAALLDGFRGAAPVERQQLAKAIVSIGAAALALGTDLVSLEVNPLLAWDDTIEALDGLAVWNDDN